MKEATAERANLEKKVEDLKRQFISWVQLTNEETGPTQKTKINSFFIDLERKEYFKDGDL